MRDTSSFFILLSQGLILGDEKISYFPCNMFSESTEALLTKRAEIDFKVPSTILYLYR